MRGAYVPTRADVTAILAVLATDCAEYEPRIKSWETHAEEAAP